MSARNSAGGQEEPIGEKTKRLANNCGQSTGLLCFKMKKTSQITVLEQKKVSRQRKFGIDYMSLVESKAPQEELKSCLRDALRDINAIQEKMNSHYDNIDEKEAETKTKIVPPGAAQVEDAVPAGAEPSINQRRKKPPIKTPSNFDLDIKDNTTSGGSPPKTNNISSASSPIRSPNKKKTSKMSSTPSKKSPGASGKPVKSPTKPPSKTKKSAGTRPNVRASVEEVPEEYRDIDSSKWQIKLFNFQGSTSYDKKGKEETISGKSIPQAIEHFKAYPGKYVAILYQKSMVTESWPAANHKYTLIHREGTENYKPQGTSPSGWMTILLQEYQHLPPFPKDILPAKFRDQYIDDMTFQKRKLHTKNKPIMPGRGMGCGDTPLLKIIGDVDPSDISQGQVGNCWMLSGISSLAEFDGAIKKLFRKTKNREQMPREGPNTYTVTLWDLKTWTEVDIEIDERLACAPDGKLLGAKPSEDGELWVPYLEKALAVHCGGWDKIVGGQCTHAWSLMTGCKEQYMIQADKSGKKYGCFGKFNSNIQTWVALANSPHDCDTRMWQCPWPKVGGGGGADLWLTKDELFQRMVAWDQQNYIVAAGTKGTSDKHKTGGLVDNHAYSVIESHCNVAGSGIDLLKVG